MNKNITDKILKFRDERNWLQFHNPKDLAISLSLEAAELLETFQWKNSDQAVAENLPKMKEELADIMIYSILFAERLGIDIESAIQDKLKQNEEKYPIEKSYGSSKKYTKL